jgi:excisionase family DNA binding protein
MDAIVSVTAMKKLAYGLRESSEALAVSVPFLRLEIARGRLRAARLGRRVVIPATELARYLEAGVQNDTRPGNGDDARD